MTPFPCIPVPPLPVNATPEQVADANRMRAENDSAAMREMLFVSTAWLAAMIAIFLLPVIL